MNNNFFSCGSYFIDEKVNFFKFANEYKIYDENGQQIGIIKQKLSMGEKILSLFIGKSSMPFYLDIINLNGEIELSIYRRWTFFMPKIYIIEPNGKIISKIHQKFRFIKPKLVLFNNNHQVIGEISGDWKGWNFKITDNNLNEIGRINKKWAGITKEFFTTADKYNVAIDLNLSDLTKRKTILAAAAIIDMLFKENN